jgi:hypothetical protein
MKAHEVALNSVLRENAGIGLRRCASVDALTRFAASCTMNRWGA